MGDILKTLAGGGQTWAHRVRMLKQVIRIALSIAFFTSLSFFISKVSKEPKHRFQAIYYFCKTILATGEETYVSSNFAHAITGKNYYSSSVRVPVKELERVCEEEILFLWKAAEKHVRASILLGIAFFLGFLIFFFFRGKRAKKKKLISGQKVKKRRLKKFSAKGGLRIGKAILPSKHETKHILITGSTGSGKTNAIHHMIPQLRKRKRKAVIVDTTGNYISKYYDSKKDYILNPFDKRSQDWHPWCEVAKKTDFKSIARCFIPLPEEKNHHDLFWKQAAAAIFESLLKKTIGEKTLSEFQNFLLTESLPTLHQKIQGTKGAPYVAKEGEKTAHSIRATLSNQAECLEHLRETDNPFSISNWVKRKERDSFLFLSCSEDQRDDVIPLISAWLGIAIKALMSLGSDYKRRFGLICDELAAMGAISGLIPLLREGRRYGACAILATQNPSQIDSIYGMPLAEDIFSNMRTKLVFAEEDPKIAKRNSLLFGLMEVLESREGISYGAHEMRDGVTHSMIPRQRPIVSATDIQILRDNECFLKLCGGKAIEKIRFKYINVPNVANPFEEREGAVDFDMSGGIEGESFQEEKERGKEKTLELNEET